MEINFDKMNGLVPAIIQDAITNKVLMLGFMNKEAYDKTVETGLAVNEWPTEQSGVWLGEGKILMVARCEGEKRQFQIISTDSGKTWTKHKTNITDVNRSTPALVYDAATDIVSNYYYERGAKKLKRRVAVAAYELEINICIHSVGGTLTFVLDDKEAQIVAKDRGPGIKDVEWALRDGTSTANDWIRSMGFGAGMGLSNSKRVSDTFDIISKVPNGTTVMCGFKIVQ